MSIDYLTIQIFVGVIFAVLGCFVYTIFRFNWKNASLSNLNELLKTLDLPLLIENLKFDNKFWKTCGIAMAISVVVVILSYQDVIANIVQDENLLVTAFKSFALGAFANLGINTLIKGSSVSSIIQAILTALATQNTDKEQAARKVLPLLEAQNYRVTMQTVETDDTGGGQSREEQANNAENQK